MNREFKEKLLDQVVLYTQAAMVVVTLLCIYNLTNN